MDYGCVTRASTRFGAMDPGGWATLATWPPQHGGNATSSSGALTPVLEWVESLQYVMAGKENER
jgi:hypothetical protein